ncbi:hypothetical protein [Demequina sp.]|uniref:hypothetical protein n=1 Tax=Demequina sp. TaxID=2050685 RepID=UPI003D09749F
METPGVLRQAGNWLAHPVSLLALVVMLVNDHVLKAQFGSWWTGKLSDAAGLVFFPALVALVVALVVPRLAWRTVVGSALTVTALGFVWVKATAMGAAAASDLLSTVAGPSVVLADRSDLLTLPFLALAGWVAMQPRVAPRWRVIAVLPIAVLASAATSAIPPDMPVQVTNVDGSLVVGLGDSPGQDPYSMSWYTQLEDGSLWSVPYDENERWALSATSAEPDTAEECLWWEPSVCYRPYEGHLGVETSDDGGTTWTVDWQVPDNERELLFDALQAQRDGYQTTGDLRTFDIAIIPHVEGGYEVWAANGFDGLAMKPSPDGEWQRVYSYDWAQGFVEPMPLPSEVEYVAAYSLPLPLVAFGVGLFLALAIITTAFRIFSNEAGGKLALFIAGIGVGGFAAVLAVMITISDSVLSPVGIPSDFILGMSVAMFLGIGGVLLVITLAITARRWGWLALLTCLVIALVGSMITAFVPLAALWPLWTGLGVCVLLSVAAQQAFVRTRAPRTELAAHPHPAAR